jgi:hypothetical protein
MLAVGETRLSDIPNATATAKHAFIMNSKTPTDDILDLVASGSGT